MKAYFLHAMNEDLFILVLSLFAFAALTLFQD